MSFKMAVPLSPLHAADGAAFSNFTTFQDVSPTGALFFQLAQLEVPMRFIVWADGELSTTGTPTLQIGLWFNTAATVLAANAATATATGAAAWPWQLEYRGSLRAGTPSNAASINGQGEVKVGGSLTAWQSGFPAPIPTTAAARTVTVDTSAARAIGIGAAWGTASASNSIKVNNLTVLILNGP